MQRDMSSEDYLYTRRMALEKFMGTYEKEYKNLKKITHECQYKCYGKEELSRNESEECARKCLQPFMMQRKVNSDMVAKCENVFSREEAECKKAGSAKEQKACLQEVSTRYDECLQKEAPKVKKCVSEYTKVFDEIVYGKRGNASA